MAGQEADDRIIRALDHYLLAAYGDVNNPDIGAAVRLAEKGALGFVMEDLAHLGLVEFATEEGLLDTSCIYRVSRDSGLSCVVYLSAVLPYGVVTVRQGEVWLDPAEVNSSSWPGSVASAIASFGITLLSKSICAAASRVRDASTGEVLDYFGALFQSEVEDRPWPR
jgi:hypothetical protein